MTTLATNVSSPKHLGLDIHLYHKYGSHKLIEDFHALRYCVSYAEVRRFLTFVAVFATTPQQVTPSGAIVPAEIVPIEKGGAQLVDASEKWCVLVPSADVMTNALA